VQQARAVARLGLASGTSRTAYVTNGDVAAFEANVRRWTGDTSGSINALVGVN
jgi:hypothetical protein